MECKTAQILRCKAVHSLKAARIALAGLLAAALLPGLFVATSCTGNQVSIIDVDPLARELTVQVTIPGNMPITKAGPGDVDGVTPESMIYSIQLWMFNHQAAGSTELDSEQAVSYAELGFGNGSTFNTANLPAGSGYYDPWLNQTVYELRLFLPGYLMDRPADDLKFDFYVLANGLSIGSTLSRTATRTELKAATFGYSADESGTTDPFGPFGVKAGATPMIAINDGSFSGPGLPISGFFNRAYKAGEGINNLGDATGVDLSFLKTGATVAAGEREAKSPVIQLTRAVAKMRFVFAKPVSMNDVTVTRIEIDGGMIPEQTYVFPRESGVEFELPGAAYMTNVAGIAGLAAADILEVENPELLRSDCETNGNKNKTAQQYDDYLTTAIGEKTTTQRFAYFRESGKPLSCKIYYKLFADGPERSVSFNMAQVDGYDAATTNFHRNHSWTVYAYFMGDGLYIKPVVLDWQDGSNYIYTQRGSAVVAISTNKQTLFGYGWTTSNNNDWWQVHQDDDPEAATEWYFRRQDEDYTHAWSYDWLHSQMVSAPGLNAGGVPIYANRIELRTNGFIVPLRLKLSDPDDFYIVTYNSASAEYVRWIEGGDQMEAGWTEADGALIPVSVAAGGTTYFYVVPKDGAEHAGKKTEAYLVTAPTDGSGSQKLPFNAGLFPGSNENTEINFYSVDVDTFKSYYDSASRPDNIKAYDKSGEVTIDE